MGGGLNGMNSYPCSDIVKTLLLLAHLLAGCGAAGRQWRTPDRAGVVESGGGSRMHHAGMFLLRETFFPCEMGILDLRRLLSSKQGRARAQSCWRCRIRWRRRNAPRRRLTISQVDARFSPVAPHFHQRGAACRRRPTTRSSSQVSLSTSHRLFRFRFFSNSSGVWAVFASGITLSPAGSHTPAQATTSLVFQFLPGAPAFGVDFRHG